MFKSPVIVGGLLLIASSAPAQVKVELLVDQNQYLLKEPLFLGIRVINHLGQSLSLSGTNWLSVLVEDREKFVVKQLEDPPAPQPVTLESTYMATQWINIGRAFDFRENDRYSIRARVHVDQLAQDIYSDPVLVEIIKGTKLWEQQVGVPGQPGAAPEIRKYVLLQANYLKELQLYAKVTDASESAVFNVVRLAPMVQISQPDAQIDTLNRLHVLTQIGMKLFMHTCLDPDGRMVLRNTYEIAGVRPQLKSSAAGSVYVFGGTRLLRWDDVPPSEIMKQSTLGQPEKAGEKAGEKAANTLAAPAPGGAAANPAPR